MTHPNRRRLLFGRRRWSSLVELAAAARRRPDLADFLTGIYPSIPLLTWAGRHHPIAVFPVPAGSSIAPNAALGTLDLSAPSVPDRVFRRAGRSYVQRLLASGRPLANLPIFAFNRLGVDDRGIPKLDCALGRYFDALGTSSVLEQEILVRLPALAAGRARPLWDRLPLRWHAHRIAGDPVQSGAGRAAAVGISTVLIFNREDRSFDVLLKERSLRLVGAVDRVHVVPSLMFQPIAGEPAREFDVVAAIEREYLEEVLGVPEHGEAPADPDAAGVGDLAFLRRLRERGEAELRLTGVAVNLLTLRPEICTLLLIRSPEWYRRHTSESSGLRRLDLSVRPAWQPGQPWSERLDALFSVPLAQVESLAGSPGLAVLPAIAALALAMPEVGET